LSAGRIQAALRDWTADALPGGYFRTTKPSEDLKTILDAFGIDRELRLPSINDLHNLKYICDNLFIM